MPKESLRHGDIVEVRRPTEILASLDDRGMHDGLPFMPEMVQFCGRRFVVDKRADKLCDTIFYTGSRRLPDTVLLEDLRCDGSAHDGCQAECRLFWKESWLRRVDLAEPASPGVNPEERVALLALLAGNTKQTISVESLASTKYVCQNTELFRASPQRLPTWDPLPYLREYTSGNVNLGRFIKVMLRAVGAEAARKLHITPRVPLRGNQRKSPAEPALRLQPGELVRVKSKAEIARTLSPDGKNRGLWFDREMIEYCGGAYRIRQRVNHFIDERSAEMVQLKSDCVTLEGAVCSGEYSTSRWFCPRAIYPYWREAWLERVPADRVVPSAERARELQSA
jgi:hypothetical protein